MTVICLGIIQSHILRFRYAKNSTARRQYFKDFGIFLKAEAELQTWDTVHCYYQNPQNTTSYDV